MSGQRNRRLGISRSPKKGLLRTVGGRPRDVYDANTPQRDASKRGTNTSLLEDSPDPISTDITPTMFTSQPVIHNRLGPIRKKSVKPNPVLGLDFSSSELDADPLASKSAPTVTSRTRRASRQPSTEPSGGHNPKVSKLDEEEPSDSAENWNGSNFLGAVFGAKSSVEDAKKVATRPKEPDRTWDIKKRVKKTYGSKKSGGVRKEKFELAPINAQDMYGTSRKKDELSDSSVSTLADEKKAKPAAKGFKNPMDEHKLPPKKPKEFVNPIDEHKLPPKKPKEYINPLDLYPPPKKITETKPEPPRSISYINPLESYKLPKKDNSTSDSESTSSEYDSKKKRPFINPKEKHALPTTKAIWEELGITSGDKERPKPTFVNPLAEFGCFAPPPSEPLLKKRRALADSNAPVPGSLLNFTSSPSEPAAASSQSSHADPKIPMSTEHRETMNAISDWVGDSVTIELPKDDRERCRLCQAVLPKGLLDSWHERVGVSIKLDHWVKICDEHKLMAMKEEWKEKNYPVIDWKSLGGRLDGHLEKLRRVLKGGSRVNSVFREEYALQQKDLRGNTAKLLRTGHNLQNSGYYGPRGANIFSHFITQELGDAVGQAAKRDALIAQGGSAGFIQSVLAPELAVLLIAEDMRVSESKARKILDDSRDLGEKLNAEDFTGDIYGEEEHGDWLDVNATQNRAAIDDSFDASFDYGYG